MDSNYEKILSYYDPEFEGCRVKIIKSGLIYADSIIIKFVSGNEEIAKALIPINLIEDFLNYIKDK